VQLDHPDGQSGALNLAAPMRIAINPALANVVFQATGKRPQVFPLSPTCLLSGSDNLAVDTSAACRQDLGLE
jgi:CO/xanthine dehydrogenase Mo-binding subunit